MYSPFDVTPILGRQTPFSFQSEPNPWVDSMGPTFTTTLSPPVHASSPFTISEPTPTVNSGSVFDLLSPDEQQLAVRRGKQAYGNQLLGAAFNGSWEALGTAFSKANQAKQEVAQKSREESLKTRQDSMDWLQKQEGEKLKQALDVARLADEKRRTGLLDRQDVALQKIAENNPAIQQALADYQAKIDSTSDPEMRKALSIKLASAKAQIQLYGSTGQMEDAPKIFEIAGKLADEVGSDAVDREKLDKLERAQAAHDGYGTDVAAWKRAQQERDAAYTGRALRVPQGRASGDPGINQGTYFTSLGREEALVSKSIGDLMKPGGSTGDRIKAAAELGIAFVPGKDTNEQGEFSPEFIGKVRSLDPAAIAKARVDNRVDTSGVHVKGFGGKDDSPTAPDDITKNPDYARLKAKKYSDPLIAAIIAAKKNKASVLEITALIRKFQENQ